VHFVDILPLQSTIYLLVACLTLFVERLVPFFIEYMYLVPPPALEVLEVQEVRELEVPHEEVQKPKHVFLGYLSAGGVRIVVMLRRVLSPF